jgi:hypothetical protein
MFYTFSQYCRTFIYWQNMNGFSLFNAKEVALKVKGIEIGCRPF